MGTYRFYIAWTSFPLMGIGVLGNLSDQSPLPLSFPVRGCVAMRKSHECHSEQSEESNVSCHLLKRDPSAIASG